MFRKFYNLDGIEVIIFDSYLNSSPNMIVITYPQQPIFKEGRDFVCKLDIFSIYSQTECHKSCKEWFNHEMDKFRLSLMKMHKDDVYKLLISKGFKEYESI